MFKTRWLLTTMWTEYSLGGRTNAIEMLRDLIKSKVPIFQEKILSSGSLDKSELGGAKIEFSFRQLPNQK